MTGTTTKTCSPAQTQAETQAALVTTAKAAAIAADAHLANNNYASSETFYLRSYELFTQELTASHFMTKAMLARVNKVREVQGKAPATDADATGVSTPLDPSTVPNQRYDTSTDPDPTCVTSDSLIRNGGAESGSVGGFATGWSRYHTYGSSGFVSTDVAHCGSNSLKFNIASGWEIIENGGVNDASYEISVVAGQHYCFSAFTYGQSGQNIRTEFLKYPSADPGTQWTGQMQTSGSAFDTGFSKYHMISSSNTWEEHKHCFTSSEDAPIIRMNIGSCNLADAPLYIDDIKLENVHQDILDAYMVGG
jgi:hypothetical protein